MLPRTDWRWSINAVAPTSHPPLPTWLFSSYLPNTLARRPLWKRRRLSWKNSHWPRDMNQQGFLYFAHCVEERVSFMTFGCILKGPIQSGLKMSDFHDCKKKWMCSTACQNKSIHILYILHHMTYYMMLYSMMFKVSTTAGADHRGWFHTHWGSEKPPWLKPRQSNDARSDKGKCWPSQNLCPKYVKVQLHFCVVKDRFIKLSFVHEA